jgi:hypothetical protein
MMSKKHIKKDVLKMLEEAGIEKHLWEKILNRFVNYAHKISHMSNPWTPPY